jgi:sugar-specific transcriptional regulator TrmB
MKSEEEIAQKLTEIGLTPLQARIYMILYYSGKEKVLTISKIAKLDRSNTYRAILQLENIGLVTKIIGTPNAYQALPLKDTISTLVSFKKTEFDSILDTAQELMKEDASSSAKAQEKCHEFRMIKMTKEKEREEIIDRCKIIQESNDLLINKKTFLQGVIDLAPEQLACIRKGVKFRVITEKIKARPILKKLKPFIAEPNFQIRYISHTSESEVVINDKKIAYVMLVPYSGLGERTMLIVDHQGCVEMFQSHFEKVWNEAQEYDFEEVVDKS